MDKDIVELAKNYKFNSPIEESFFVDPRMHPYTKTRKLCCAYAFYYINWFPAQNLNFNLIMGVLETIFQAGNQSML